jgi:hypothetical protein
MLPSGQDIAQEQVHGDGIVPGTTVATVGTILGTTAIGITLIAHGTTAGTIPGTTDGTTHTGAHGDGHTTDITAGTRLTGMVDTTHIIHTILEEAAAVITTLTEVQATRAL